MHKATKLEDTYFTHAGPKNDVSIEALSEFFIPFRCILHSQVKDNGQILYMYIEYHKLAC
jgi:hypothetical protein